MQIMTKPMTIINLYENHHHVGNSMGDYAVFKANWLTSPPPSPNFGLLCLKPGSDYVTGMKAFI